MKNKKVLLIIIVFLIVVLIGFAGAYAYIALDVFKTPKQLFAKYLDNQITQAKTINMGALGTVKEKIKNEVSEIELEMKADDEYDEIMSGLKIGLKRNPATSSASLALKYSNSENENFANYELYADKEKLALKIPELNEKFFSIQINTIIEQLNKYIKENELSEKEIDLSVEKIDKYKTEFIALYNKYTEYVKNTYLTDNRFTAEKDVQIDVDGTAMTANAYIFNLSYAEFYDIIKDVCTKLLDEPTVKEILSEEKITDIKEQLDEIEDIEEGNLKVCLYAKSGKTVKVEIKANDEIVAEFMIIGRSGTQTDIIINTSELKSETTEVRMTQKILYTINVDSSDTTTTTITSSTTYNKDDIEALKNKNKADDDSNDYASFTYSDEWLEEEYKDITATQKMTTTLNGDNAISKMVLDDTVVDEMKINYKFGSNVKFPVLDDSIVLEDYINDQTKLTGLLMECSGNLLQHPDTLLGSLGSQTLAGNNDLLSGNIFGGNLQSNTNSSDNEVSTQESTPNDTYKENLEELITDALKDCLDSYQRDLEEDANANIADYLTVNKISEMILSSSVKNLELVDGLTLKCNYFDDIYYITLELNADPLSVGKVEAYTESEYEEL